MLLTLFRLIVTSRGWGDHDAREVADRALQLAEAGAFSDDNARLWWSLFFLLIDRDDHASYVDVARSLLSACEAPDPHGRIGERLPGLRAPHGHLRRFVHRRPGAAHRHLTRAGELIEAATAAETAAYDENLHVMYHLIEGAWFGMQGDGDAHQRAVEAAVALADADGRPFPRAVARTLGAVQGFYSPGHDYLKQLAAPALDLDLGSGSAGWSRSPSRSTTGPRRWPAARAPGPSPPSRLGSRT